MSRASRTPQGRPDRSAATLLARRIRPKRPSPVGFDLSGATPHTQGDLAIADGLLDPAPDPAFRPTSLPAGRTVVLPQRGTTWVHEHPGPPGAPTLVLLHGWTVTAGLNWFPSFPALADAFRVVALDHRGHGRGIRDGRRFRLEDCADDVAALADALGIDRFVPVGYSMGGPIAQLLWQRHRDRIAGLVLCATSRNFRGTPIERAVFSAIGGLSIAARLTPLPWRQELNARLALRRYDDSQLGHWARREIARNDPRAIIEAGHALGRFTSHDWIGEVDVPTGVVITETDAVVPPERQRKLATSIADVATFPVAADHAVCVLRPELFVPALFGACVHATGRRHAGRPHRPHRPG